MTATVPTPGVAAVGVARSYGARSVLCGIDLTLSPGRLTAVLGPSGSGKSTLLRLLAGLEPIDAGYIMAGKTILSMPGRTVAPEQRRIGMVFQDYALFPHLSAGDNVAFGLAHLSRAERKARALQWLDAVGLADKALRAPHMLSGGEQQRVALARALAPEPAAVLLDEPFSGLDGILRADLRDLTVRTLQRTRAAVLLVTHDAQEAMAMADDLAVLDHGRIAQIGAPAEVWDAPACLAAAAALSPLNTWRGRVAGGRLDTPFGAAATTLPDGGQAVLAVRQGALRIMPGATARIVERRRVGDAVEAIITPLTMDSPVWRARISHGDAPAPGPCSLDLTGAGVFVFAA